MNEKKKTANQYNIVQMQRTKDDRNVCMQVLCVFFFIFRIHNLLHLVLDSMHTARKSSSTFTHQKHTHTLAYLISTIYRLAFGRSELTLAIMRMINMIVLHRWNIPANKERKKANSNA